MNNFKFIHAADIHLGSILHTGERKNKVLLQQFNDAVYKAFEKICTTAIKEKVKFLLLCGDIYDKDLRSVKANSFFIAQCERLKAESIRVFVIGGNHDPSAKDRELFKLPSNVYMFSADHAETVELRDEAGNLYCKVIGQSYKEAWDKRQMYKNYKLIYHEVFTIAMLHTQLDNNSNYVPGTISDLKAMNNIDYWALGHIHKAEMLSSDFPAVFYSGIPQGRDFGEQGIGGVILCNIENNRLKMASFIPVGTIIWNTIDVEINTDERNKAENLGDLEALVLHKAEKLIAGEIVMNNLLHISKLEEYKCEGYVISWDIKGKGNIYDLINDKEEIEEYFKDSLNSKLLKFSPFVYTNSVKLNIGKTVEDLQQLKLSNNVIKSIYSFTENADEIENMKRNLIKELSELWEEPYSMEDIDAKRFQMNDEIMGNIVADARELIMELLLQRGEQHEI